MTQPLQQPSSTVGAHQRHSPCYLVAVAFLLLADVTFGQQPAVGSQPQYELQGYIRRIDRSGKTNHWCDFWVAVSGRRSLIKLLYFNGESFACGTDGTDSYLLNEMLPAARQNHAAHQFADISGGPFPDKGLSAMQLVWLCTGRRAACTKPATNCR